MTPLAWILVSGAAMSVIALVGILTVAVRVERLERLLLPLVAFAAGALLGGALFHMLPAAVAGLGNGPAPYVWLASGFLAFFCLEQFLHWHHCHRTGHGHVQPLGHLVLIADGVHNLLGGISVGAVFLVDVRLGWAAWLAAAAHEVPQEIGDFGVLLHAGWSRRRALLYNLLSALTFPFGGFLAWAMARELDVAGLIAFGAGNFLYIAAADLVPEVKRSDRLGKSALHFASLLLGMGLLLLLHLLEGTEG